MGVAQPYVFSLFPTKRDLFLAAVEHDFQLVADTFTRAAEEFDGDNALPDMDLRHSMGQAYVELLHGHRDLLMLQHQAYAACDDPVIRDQVRRLFAQLVAHVERLWDAEPGEIDEFIRYGMWLNVAAAMGVEDLSVGCEWMRQEAKD